MDGLLTMLEGQGYDPESWYYHAESGLTLQTVIDRWQKQRPGEDRRGRPLPRQKLYDSSQPLMVPVAALWPHREYTWTRGEARSGFALVGGKTVDLPGPEKWDAIHADMKSRGWLQKYPIHFYIGDDGGQKVGEGNHRLAIARSLGIRMAPVQFFFGSGRVRKNKRTRRSTVEIPKRAVRAAIEKPKPRRKLTPQDHRDIDELMKLLW